MQTVTHSFSHSTILVIGATLALLALLAFGLLGLAQVLERPAPPATLAVAESPTVTATAPMPPPPVAASLNPSPTALPAARPLPPTATPRPTPTRTPMPLQPGDLNVLLLGADEPNKAGDWRTDTIVIVAVRPRAGFVAMLSVPRDLWVDIPGYGMQRINTADYRGEVMGWPGGGPGLVGDTLEANLGIPVHAWVRVDFQGLVKIIDALGGITVDVTEPLTDPTLGNVHFDAGVQHMDGATALRYARSRYATNDLDRTRRQQQILLAIRDQALRPATFLRLPTLIAALADAVDTDLNAAQVLSLADLARRLDVSAYRTRVFDTTMVRDWVTPGGAMVLLYDRARVEEAWAGLTAVER